VNTLNSALVWQLVAGLWLFGLGLSAPARCADPLVEVLGVTIEPGAAGSTLTVRLAREVSVGQLRHPDARTVTLDLPGVHLGQLPEDLPIGAGGLRALRSRRLPNGALRLELTVEAGWTVRLSAAARSRSLVFLVLKGAPPAKAPAPRLQPLVAETSRARAALKQLPPPNDGRLRVTARQPQPD